MPASYPTSAKSFTTKANGGSIDASHINDLQLEVAAIETDLIAGLPIARGGTGLTSLTANRIPYGNGTSALQSSASLTFDGTTLTAPATTITGPVDASGASAGQIKFPATQNAATDVNTLDDYEEGTWTPVLGGSGGTSGQTYTYQKGAYVKIGKLVIAQFDVSLSNKGTITTNAQIQGLPFTSENTANQNWAAKVFFNTGAGGTALLECCGLLAPNTTAMDLFAAGSAVTVQVNLTTANLDTAVRFAGVVMYRATA